MKTLILNASVVTSEGNYSMRKISLERAKILIANGFISAIGHESTAKIISQLLGILCPVDRKVAKQEPGQTALVFKMRGRPPEGKILNKVEVDEIGYDFFELKEISPDMDDYVSFMCGGPHAVNWREFVMKDSTYEDGSRKHKNTL